MLLNQRSAGSVAAAGLALALSTATPQLVAAAINPPAVVRLRSPAVSVVHRDTESTKPSCVQVQQYGSSMLAEEELRPAQKKFLEERAVSASHVHA